ARLSCYIWRPGKWERAPSRIANNLLKDELDHLDIGVRRIQGLMEQDSDDVHDSLVWSHHRVMPLLFDMVHQSCQFLCDNHDLDCDMVDKGTTTIDLDLLKVAALENYVGMLDTAGFDMQVVNQLIATMTSYEAPGRSNIGLGFLEGRASKA
ncbi:hypothetical protein, partial [Candidatus Entotheonella palauensis]|uniref:hypothetical protein n=1 Tax=Candidatus Entotheonella palauensis TaxID=93172 RepID=UPI0015C41EB6